MWRKAYTPNAEEIQRTARAVIQVLAEHNFNGCLFGSTAAAIYGAENRNPRDVDIIVIPPFAASSMAPTGLGLEIPIEDIKQLIVDNSSSDFYLSPSKDPHATYKILYYILTPSHPDPKSPKHHSCKVDLLLPGMIGIPKRLSPEVLHYEDYFPDLPLLPFLVLLLLKVRAWTEHGIDGRFLERSNSPRDRMLKEKLKNDENDIKELLDLGVNEYLIRLKPIEVWAGWEWADEMKQYVRKHVDRFPALRSMWEEIGFVLKSEWSLPPRGMEMVE